MNRPRPVKLGPFTGINNRLPDHAMYNPDTAGFLRDSVNLDLTDAGTLKRREGYTQVLAGTRVRSLWSNDLWCLFAEGDTLYRFDGTNKVAVRSGISPTRAVSYADTPLGIVWSDGTILERITPQGISTPLTVPTPNPVPTVSITTGALWEGQYLVAFAQAGSPLTTPVQLELPANGGLTLGGTVAAPTDVYLSPVNAPDLFRVVTLPAGVVNWAITAPPAYGGAPVDLEGMHPMPAGTIVRRHGGRLLVVSGNFLYYSNTYHLGLYNPIKNYIPTPTPITLVAPVVGGVYLADGNTTWFLPGEDIAQAEMRQVLPFGAVPGSMVQDPTQDTVWWYTDRGVVRGTPGGTVEQVQEASVAVESGATAAASLVREQDGMQRVITSTFGSSGNSAAATSFIDAQVVRKETEL